MQRLVMEQQQQSCGNGMPQQPDRGRTGRSIDQPSGGGGGGGGGGGEQPAWNKRPPPGKYDRRTSPSPSRDAQRCCCVALCPTNTQVFALQQAVGELMCASETLKNLAHIILFVGWGIFVVMANVSTTYYNEHLRPDTPPHVIVNGTLSPMPTPATTKPLPGTETAKAHFPWTVAHLAACLAVTTAYVLMWLFEFGPAKHKESAIAWNLCQSMIMLVVPGMCLFGFFWSFGYLITLVSVVGTFDGRMYLLMVDLWTMIAVLVMCTAVVVMCVHKWQQYRENTQRRPNDEYDED